MYENSKIKELFKYLSFGEKYKIGKLLNRKSNISVYQGQKLDNRELLTIKIEQKKDKNVKGILEKESHYLDKLKSKGIPAIVDIGIYQDTIISIQSSLGPTLEQIFKKYVGCFNIKDVVIISIQLLERLKYLHNKGIIYYNVSPENLSVGLGRFQNIIYFNNFYFSEKIQTKKTYLREEETSYIFSSNNKLKGIQYSKRDDLISLGYMILFFLRGGLPWESLIYSPTKEEKRRKIIQMKQKYEISKLCEGYPEEFKLYIEYVSKLKLNEEINYSYCFSLFYEIFHKNFILNDGIFSWCQERKKPKKNFYKNFWEKRKLFQQTSFSSKNKIFVKLNPNKRANSCFLNLHNPLEKIIDLKRRKENDKKCRTKKRKMEIKIINRNCNSQGNSDKEYSIEGEIEQISPKDTKNSKYMKTITVMDKKKTKNEISILKSRIKKYLNTKNGIKVSINKILHKKSVITDNNFYKNTIPFKSNLNKKMTSTRYDANFSNRYKRRKNNIITNFSELNSENLFNLDNSNRSTNRRLKNQIKSETDYNTIYNNEGITLKNFKSKRKKISLNINFNKNKNNVKCNSKINLNKKLQKLVTNKLINVCEYKPKRLIRNICSQEKLSIPKNITQLKSNENSVYYKHEITYKNINRQNNNKINDKIKDKIMAKKSKKSFSSLLTESKTSFVEKNKRKKNLEKKKFGEKKK